MNKKVFSFIFYAFAIISLVAMLYHVKGFFQPTILTPAWRHAIFVVVNIISIYGLLKRPKWFIFFVALLTIQQWYSHGSYAIELWQKENKIHWISIVDIILLPVLFVLLIIDSTNKKIKFPSNL